VFKQFLVPVVLLAVCVLCVYSEFDVRRHVSCERCTSRVTGGFDTINNQVCSITL